jgi:hypothetical protein
MVTEAGKVNGIWSDFQGPIPGVFSWDHAEMRYWPDGWGTPGNFQAADLVRDKKGRCGAWEDLYRSVLSIHSIGASVLSVYPNKNLPAPTPPTPSVGYLVPAGVDRVRP